MLVENSSNIQLLATSTNQNNEIIADLVANYNETGVIITAQIYINDPVLDQDILDFKESAFNCKDEMMERVIALRYTEN